MAVVIYTSLQLATLTGALAVLISKRARDNAARPTPQPVRTRR